MSYRDDVDALAARHAALEFEVVEKTKERNAAASLLEEAKVRAKLPVLDNIRIATPCTVEWSAMTGDERVRACGACNKNVYNVSSMTRDEAEALITEKEGSLCVRYFQRHDGTILLADCSIGIKQKRKRRVLAASAAALLAGTALFAWKLSRHKSTDFVPFATQTEENVSIAGGLQPLPIPPPELTKHDLNEVKGRMSVDMDQDGAMPKPTKPKKVSKIHGSRK